MTTRSQRASLNKSSTANASSVSQSNQPPGGPEPDQTSELLRVTLDSSFNYIQVFKAVRDQRGDIIDFTWALTNRKWNEAFGDVIGKSLLAQNPAVVETGVFARMVQVTQTGEPQTHEEYYPYEQFNGWFHQTIARVGDGVALTTEEITERKRAEEALRLADRRKDEFLALLVHELRNPLATLHNTLLILQLTDGQDESMPLTKALGLMDQEVAHLVRLVDDLLDVSRISQGNIALLFDRVDLVSVVRDALEAVRPQFRISHRTLDVSLPNEPIYLNGDATRLKQVVNNLLNNAAKFTSEGGHIWVGVEQVAESAVLRVRDNGIGLPAYELERIFETFAQIDTSVVRREGGLGLGLTLVRELVHLHGGRVEAHSAGLGQGSEFTVRLPVGTDGTNPIKRSSSRQPLRGPKRHILVVDDNPSAATTLAALLKLLGNDVHTRFDGQTGVEAAEHLRPEIVVLDIAMPGLDGYQVCRRIREHPWGKAMKLIALSGYGQPEDKRRGQEAGFDAYLVKPVNLAALKQLLTVLPPA